MRYARRGARNVPGDRQCRMPTRRVALVTGGNRGIRLEVCRQLARHGLRVILTARDAAKGRAAADRLRTDSRGAIDVAVEPLDVTDAQSIDALARTLGARGEPVDVVVNNAAVLIGE